MEEAVGFQHRLWREVSRRFEFAIERREIGIQGLAQQELPMLEMEAQKDMAI